MARMIDQLEDKVEIEDRMLRAASIDVSPEDFAMNATLYGERPGDVWLQAVAGALLAKFRIEDAPPPKYDTGCTRRRRLGT